MARYHDVPFLFFDVQRFLDEGGWIWDGESREGRLWYGDTVLELSRSRVSGIYSRLIDTTELLAAETRGAARVRLRALVEMLDACEVAVVNRPRLEPSNGSKLYHLWVLEKFRFTTPRSLLTNSWELLSDFLEQNGRVLYKGASSEKTVVSLFTNTEAARSELLRNSPVLFQAYVPGVDVRLHLVRGEAIALSVTSERSEDSLVVDYRFDPSPKRYAVVPVPDDVLSSCNAYQAWSGLDFIGFDFRVSQKGWTILEANPMPGYESYDRRVDNRIFKALLSLLSVHR
ncbi:ATP-grasp domain-containing protein [Microbispora bryophytorum]|nr:hypothetical protein [Microbispora bryophytorum]MBD3135818.1 hypothetical protein [Microbispora bryophytorum]TQS09967.1 hypothetical protein FLX07_02670 [Microbispora bryophytorum]